MSRSIFGWSYPPGCSGPPDDSIPPCCEECPEEKFEECQEKHLESECIELYFLGMHACCLKHREVLFEDGVCGSCMAEAFKPEVSA